MTLILTKASSDYVLQASDRLITSAATPLDFRSNKGIVFACDDAILSLAYTGMAVLDEVPTDQWLAERLLDYRFERGHKVAALPGRIFPPRETLGQAVGRLAKAIEDAEQSVRPAFARQWLVMEFDIVAAGWHWNKRNRSRPIIVWVHKEKGRKETEKRFHDRLWHFPRGGRRPFVTSAAPVTNYSYKELETLNLKLQNQSLETCEAILVDEIRTVSSRVPQVGRDILSVALSPPNISEGLVFDRAETSRSRSIPSSFVRDLKTDVSITPWLIGPGGVVPPLELSHSRNVQLGKYNIRLAAPDQKGAFFMGGLPRAAL